MKIALHLQIFCLLSFVVSDLFCIFATECDAMRHIAVWRNMERSHNAPERYLA